MNRNTTLRMIAAAVLMTGSVLFAQQPAKPAAGDPLENALGPTKPADTAAPAVEAPKPDQSKPALDPTAAAKHDQEDLINDLNNGKKVDQAKKDPKQMVQDFIDNTKAAGDNMKLKQDAGADTQDHQRRATVAMDQLIEIVKEQMKQQSQSQSQSQQQAQQRQQNPGEGDQDGPHNDSGTNAAKTSQIPGGGVNPFRSNNDIISKDPKEWGNLPPKDRDQILNSLQDGALKAYQEKVRKYYEALAEIGRGK